MTITALTGSLVLTSLSSFEDLTPGRRRRERRSCGEKRSHIG